MNWLLASSLVLLAAPLAMAQDVRPAGEEEITAALQGCWTREPTFEHLEDERSGVQVKHHVCFRPDGSVSAAGTVLQTPLSLETREASGTFSIIDEKLVVTSAPTDGWIFGRGTMTCDVVMRPGVAMRLQNCVGSGWSYDWDDEPPAPAPDMSFTFDEVQP